MNAVGHSTIDDVRTALEPLAWPDRFDRLAAIEKSATDEGYKRSIVQLRGELAERALAELSAEWNGVPFKQAILRLPSKWIRNALGRTAKQLRDRRIIDAMADGGSGFDERLGVRHRFAVGLDERVIEVPMALKSARLHEPGTVLDAGAALNLPVVRQVVGRPAAHVTHITLPGVEEPHLPGDEDRFVHATGDLRALPYADATFDRVACVSTLEHVGMDNSRYGATTESSTVSATTAVSELLRVLAPNGELLITVPYGRAADHEWFRVFDAASLGDLLSPASRHQMNVRFFYYDSGWAEGEAAPPSTVLDAGFLPDVVTGIAVARVLKAGARA